MSKFAILGNAVVDCLAHVPPVVLERFKLTKADTSFLPVQNMLEISHAIPVESFRSGGSTASLAWTLSRLGHQVNFLGRVGTDPAGRHFFEDMVQAGVTMPAPVAGLRTTEVFVLVTPDGSRTVAQPQPTAPDTDDTWVEENMLDTADWLVVSAFTLLDHPAAFWFAVNRAHAAGKPVILKLSLPRAVSSVAEELAPAVAAGKFALIIGNRHEYETLQQHAQAAGLTISPTQRRVITRSGEGASYVETDGTETESAVTPIDTPVDATGAGDAFTAGFLAVFTEHPLGRATPQQLEEALRRGHKLGRACVQHFGPRLPDPQAAWHGTLTS